VFQRFLKNITEASEKVRKGNINFVTLVQTKDFKVYYMPSRYCLFKIITLQKIRKNKDASQNQGRFKEVKTTIFVKI